MYCTVKVIFDTTKVNLAQVGHSRASSSFLSKTTICASDPWVSGYRVPRNKVFFAALTSGSTRHVVEAEGFKLLGLIMF